ncbi:uncharacterized protein BX664DRAFT_281565 [Halteromyces radiatus]|uniref:uncharacterized protein n=1 Tax=Halteromyces radiatus TaxID=101107 RepID=UPI0022205CA3|nr:uncharacterized protein BX664DRAFT_281565 [Halteromyces radiatus]KAI8086008.1 hypothetical protein BX664DRAFT_281565 [Halteromyces radiatus]
MNKRNFMTIDLIHFEQRKNDIIQDIMKASTEQGFFYVINHGIDEDQIQHMFKISQDFFDLPESTKTKYPLDVPRNAGYENFAQLRPQTGLPDLKESMQLAFHHIPDLWPSEQDIPDFQSKVQRFMQQCNKVSQQLLECFALGLGFPQDFFTRSHDISQPDCLNSLRFHHYFDLTNTMFDPHQGIQWPVVDAEDVNDYYRAGPHTDPDTLTLLFQNNPGHDCLEACQGRTDVTQFVQGTHWLPLCPQKNELVCNIGDMLMRWSDDLLRSNFHRVNRPINDLSSRYTIAYFTQANKSAIIQGRSKYIEPLTAGDFLRQAMERNHQRVKLLIDQRQERKRLQIIQQQQDHPTSSSVSSTSQRPTTLAPVLAI